MGWEKKYLEFECMHVEKETEKALQVVINNQTLWVPKSQIAEDSEVSSEGQSGVIKLSEWILEKRACWSREQWSCLKRKRKSHQMKFHSRR